jgi:hypothetical protein
MELQLGNELGRGAYGKVYEKIDNPAVAVKVSDKLGNSCRLWSNEYKKIVDVLNILEVRKEYKSLKKVKILKPIQFNESSALCYMEIPRVYRPDQRRSSKQLLNNTNTLHSLLGKNTIDIVFKGRGQFIGLAELQQYLTYQELEEVSLELGIAMALIHFVAKNDAYDIEVFLGREYNSKKLRFYIADFDLTEEIQEYDDTTVIDRIAWSLSAVQYFPTKTSDENLYKLFKTGYISVAGDTSIVKSIFDEYNE